MHKVMTAIAMFSGYVAAAFLSALAWFALGILTGCLGMCTRGDAWENLWREIIWWIPALAVIPAYLIWQRSIKKLA
jgi:hypothetical protein